MPAYHVIDEHLKHIGENRPNYLSHLLGKVEYALFINPNDSHMEEYKLLLNELM